MRLKPFILLAFFAVSTGCGVSSDVDRRVGARCDDSDECDERCLTATQGYPGGFCTVFCEADGDCGGGEACLDEEGGICLFDCTDNQDCAFLGAGWQCAAGTTVGGSQVMVCRGS